METNNCVSFDLLNKYNLINFVTNKHVGINYNYQSVDEIKELLQKLTQVKFRKIVNLKQIHSNNVLVVNEDNLFQELEAADGVITNLKGVALIIATADCQPIMLYDSKNEVIANVHSGWKGTLNKILEKTINKMVNMFESKPEDIVVCIGPSILKCCFEVDEEVVRDFKNNFDDIDGFITLGNVKMGKQKYYIDTIGINKKELSKLGILEQNIFISDICTKCNSDIYYSYRAHGVSSGRNVSLIAMKNIEK